MTSGIYKITHIESGKTYYGSSQNIEKRWKRHKKELNNNTHHNVYLQRSWNKYGDNAFMFYIVEEVEYNLLLDVEQQYIDGNVDGYNIASACGGDIITNHPNKNEIIEKIRKTIHSNIEQMNSEERNKKFGHSGETNGMFGKTHNEETRRKISVATKGKTRNKGIPKSEAAKRKYSEIAKQRIAEKNPFYGKHHSDETKQILREKMSGKNSWIKGIEPKDLPYTKQYKITYENGDSEIIYGLKEIANRYNVSITAIYLIIKRGCPNKSGNLKGIKIEEIKLPYSYE